MNFSSLTSHFIGVALNADIFADLFVELQHLIRREKCQGVTLVNPLSVHLTLYYLPKSIQDLSLQRVLTDLKKQEAIDTIHLKGFAYFETERKQEHLLYLSVEEFWPGRINQQLAQALNHTDLPDNSLDFVAHISILKIENYSEFKRIQPEIEKYVARFIQKKCQQNLFLGIHLYAVSSLFQPELQIIKH